MDMPKPGMMSPRKQMAGGEAGGTFGVGKIANPIAHPDRTMDTSKSMPEASRGTAPAMSRGPGMMKATRNSDQGPHNHPMGKR
jgi:hypothetical protein